MLASGVVVEEGPELRSYNHSLTIWYAALSVSSLSEGSCVFNDKLILWPRKGIEPVLGGALDCG